MKGALLAGALGALVVGGGTYLLATLPDSPGVEVSDGGTDASDDGGAYVPAPQHVSPIVCPEGRRRVGRICVLELHR